MAIETLEPEVIPVSGQNEPADIDVSALPLDQIEQELAKLDQITTTPEVDEEAPAQDKATEELPKSPEETPAPGQVETEKQLVITDAVISKFNPEDQKILQNFKGKPIEEALKSLVNAQRLVGKKQEQQPIKEVAKPYVPKDVAEKEEIEGIKENLLLSRLKNKFEDFPKTQEEWAELNYQNPRKAFQYYQEEQKEKSSLDQDVNQYMEIRGNYPVINKSTVESQLTTVAKTIEEMGVTVADLKIDLSLEKAADEDSIANKILRNDEGTDFDPRVVQMVGFGNDKFPVVNSEAFQFKFWKMVMPQILQLGNAKARADGFKQAQSKTPPPSLSNSAFKGVQKQPDVLTDDVIKTLSADQIEAELKKLERF